MLAFAERVQKTAPAGLDVQLITFADGAWSVGSLSGLVTAHVPTAPAPAINTRRVPRFAVRNPLSLKIDGQPTNLIDMSIMGAQVLSAPVLRPSEHGHVACHFDLPPNAQQGEEP